MTQIDFGGNMSSQIKSANKARNEMAQAMVEGKVDFHDIVEASRSKNFDYLKRLKLITILLEYGWSRKRAKAALIKNGFSERDNVLSIRQNPGKVSLFASLPRMETSRWDLKPKLSTKFPKEGALSDVMNILIEEGFEFPDNIHIKSEKVIKEEEITDTNNNKVIEDDSLFEEEDIFGDEDSDDDDFDESNLFGDEDDSEGDFLEDDLFS